MPRAAVLGNGQRATEEAETRGVTGVPCGMVAGLSLGTERAGGSCLVVTASELVSTGVVAEARVGGTGSGWLAPGDCSLTLAEVETADDGVVMEALGISADDDGVAVEAFGSTAGDEVVMKAFGSTVGDGVVMKDLGTLVVDGLVMRTFCSRAGGEVVTKALDGLVGDRVVKAASTGMVGKTAEVTTGERVVCSVLMGKAANDSTVGAAGDTTPRDSSVDILCDGVEINGRVPGQVRCSSLSNVTACPARWGGLLQETWVDNLTFSLLARIQQCR